MADFLDDAHQQATASFEDHVMTIEQDDGVHRCIHFGRPGASAYSYRLVTWPGHLAISGDLEDFTFSRLLDMFEFFRHDRPNYSYWAQKTTARSSFGTKVFSDRLYRSAVVRELWEMRHEIRRTTGRSASEVLRDVREELLADEFPDEREAIMRTMDFSLRTADELRTWNLFHEFYEHRLTEPSFNFRLSCWAIVHGIKSYDAAKARAAKSPELVA
ncbi:hypothetical protein SAMN05444336_11285 [Albimonas donghaensis]|uniref:Uncharacterized protein n=1 Tax=Albimonas donghaensis TaxID=356660 RepID=A0A1H3FF92_9RHOB|nr:hypothetical protein [Albimonas donghaensis]SDX89545.1 hypothetical protein SAMN05444336_11285 [Albimonas donghaensis]